MQATVSYSANVGVVSVVIDVGKEVSYDGVGYAHFPENSNDEWLGIHSEDGVPHQVLEQS